MCVCFPFSRAVQCGEVLIEWREKMVWYCMGLGVLGDKMKLVWRTEGKLD